MAATFTFGEDNGNAAGSPPKGTSRTDPVVNVNWKNIDDATTAYGASPIAAGNNGYVKWQFGHFAAPFNAVLNGLWSHTAGTAGTGITLFGTVSPARVYTTPATTPADGLTDDQTATTAIAAGLQVAFGPTGPEAGGKGAGSATVPCYTPWLITQLRSAGTAAAGDTTPVTYTLRYDENGIIGTLIPWAIGASALGHAALTSLC